MPKGDGTGPEGKGPTTGRGLGKFSGNNAGGYMSTEQPKQGMGRGNRQGRGLGRRGDNTQNGDFCICPNCGYKILHSRGNPCNQIKCPECGAMMSINR